MKLSSGCLGIIGFVMLIALTGICSLSLYTISRDGVISLWQGGIQVNSVGEVAQALLNPADFTVPSATPSPINQALVIASPTPQSVLVTPSPNAESPVQPTSDTTLQTVQATAILPTATTDPAQEAIRQVGPREINILLLGIDQRIGFDTERSYRTDTMIVLHIDPVRKMAGVISFPRDLWVNIPTYNSQERINTANFIGDNNAYPGGGGPALAMETIRTNFGIRLDHYLLVNFTVFETVVDILAPQGIQINVTETIRDPDYPDAGFGTINVEFDPGLQVMNGQRLLQYARTRATGGSDLDRARRQQEVIEGLRQHVLNQGGAQNFITQAGRLWGELTGSYRTSLSLDEIIALAYLMNEIPRENIRYSVVGLGYTDLGQTPDGTQQVLIPIHSRIQELIQQTFYPEIGVTSADLRERAERENASVLVYNNTTTAGLAGRTQEYLIGQGVRVDGVGNMPAPDNGLTVIRDYGGASDTALWIAGILGLPADRVQRGSDGLTTRGVIVVVGNDLQSLISGQP